MALPIQELASSSSSSSDSDSDSEDVSEPLRQPTIKYTYLSVNRTYLSVDRPYLGVDRPYLGVDRPYLSVDRPRGRFVTSSPRGSVEKTSKALWVKHESLTPGDCHFLKLPPEVRNMIYELVHVSPENIGLDVAHRYHRSFPYDEAAKWRNLSFSMACREIYRESTAIFYSKNCFEFYRVHSMIKFFDTIGSKCQGQITKLKFNYQGADGYKAFKRIGNCRNLQHLEVLVQQFFGGDAGFNICHSFPLKNAKQFFFTDYNKIEYGPLQNTGTRKSGVIPTPSRVQGIVYHWRFDAHLKAFKLSQTPKEKRAAVKEEVRSSTNATRSVKNSTKFVFKWESASKSEAS